MPEPTPAAAAATQTPAFDMAAFTKALTDSISSSIGAAIKPFADRLEKLEAPPASDKAHGHNLTAEDFGKIMDDKLNAHNASQSKRQARDQHVQAKMKDVPAAYLRDLPETDDPKVLEAAEQKIRETYRADLKAAGITAPPVGAHKGGSSTITEGKIDVSKWTDGQKIESLIATSRPSFQGQAPPENPAAGAEGKVTQADAI